MTLRDLIYRYNAVAAVDGAATAAARVNPQLAKLGCAIVLRPGERAWLAIADAHPAVDGLFAGSAWGEGRWREALRQAPDNLRSEGPAIIDGLKWACILIAVEAVS